jgi:elongation factor G
MKVYAAEKLRNIVLVGHGGSGKSSLAEAMLFTSGAITRLGRVDEGNTVTDFDPDEVRRKMSLSLSLAYCEWQDHKINILDTPGFADFVGEVRSGLHVADAAVFVISAVAGVEVQAEIFWRQADKYALPRLIFVNKMDRENADFEAAVKSINQRLGTNAVAVQIPIGAADKFGGFIDLIAMKAFVFSEGGLSEQEVPAQLAPISLSYRERLIEATAESDDSLLENYLEGQELTTEELTKGLRVGAVRGNLIPIVCGSALKNAGVSLLLDTILHTLPSPLDAPQIKGINPKTETEETRKPEENEPFSSLVFKTIVDPYIGKLNIFRAYSGTLSSDSHVLNASKDKTERIGQLLGLQGKKQEPIGKLSAGDFAAVAKLQETGTGDTLCQADRPIILPKPEFPEPVISTAIRPKSKGDEDKLSTALSKLQEEDPTFSVHREGELRQTILSGMGDTHLELIVDRLKRKFGVEAEQETLKTPYRETIRSKVQAQGKHKKQTGGHGQFGDAWIEIEPLERGKGFEFVNKIFGGAIPRQYIPAVEKGVREAMVEGHLAGYPVVDVRVTLNDGSYHPVDSSEMAFKLAGSLAFRNAVTKADPVLLEPVLGVEVRVPDAYMGDIIGDLNSKRGKILGMEPLDGEQIIRAQVPAAEMSKYANDLRSVTQGRGTFKVEFSHYEEVPGHISQRIIEEIKAAKQ